MFLLRLHRQSPRYEPGLIVDADGRVLTSTFRAANRGARLLGLRGLPKRSSLLLPGEPIVHSRGLTEAIDVVFLSRQGRVVAVRRSLGPGFRVSACLRARAALELPAGRADELSISNGSMLRFESAGEHGECP